MNELKRTKTVQMTLERKKSHTRMIFTSVLKIKVIKSPSAYIIRSIAVEFAV